MFPAPLEFRVAVIEVAVIVRVTFTPLALGGIEKLSPAFAALALTEKLGLIMQYSFQLQGPQFHHCQPRSIALIVKLHCQPLKGELVEAHDIPEIDPAVPPVKVTVPGD